MEHRSAVVLDSQVAVELGSHQSAVEDNPVVLVEGKILEVVALDNLAGPEVDNILVVDLAAIELVGLDHTLEVVVAIDPAGWDRTSEVAGTVQVQVDELRSSDGLWVEAYRHIHSIFCTSNSSQSTSAFDINSRPNLEGK